MVFVGTGSRTASPTAIRTIRSGMIMKKTVTRIQTMRRNRVFSGFVQINKWYVFSMTVNPKLATNIISVAAESELFIWFTGVFTMLIRLLDKNYNRIESKRKNVVLGVNHLLRRLDRSRQQMSLSKNERPDEQTHNAEHRVQMNVFQRSKTDDAEISSGDR